MELEIFEGVDVGNLNLLKSKLNVLYVSCSTELEIVDDGEVGEDVE